MVILALHCPARVLADSPQLLQLRVTQHRLTNGWTFLFVERHKLPVVSFLTVAGAGSSQDGHGTTGLAHMFEHMAFKGTTVVGTTDFAREAEQLELVESTGAILSAEIARPGGGDPGKTKDLAKRFQAAQDQADRFGVPGAFEDAIRREGGIRLNAFTNTDVTGYSVSLPANKVELWAYLESGRFLNPVFRQFYKEKEVVKHEQTLRTGSPGGRAFEEFVSLAFKAHPYRYPVLGYPSDLSALTASDARRFHAEHYVPANMITAIVGDIDPARLIPLLETYFGRIPAGPPARPVRTVEPPQEGERRTVLPDRRQSLYLEGYHVPAASHPDAPALQAVAHLLGSGRASRLYVQLVRERRLGERVSAIAGYPGQRYPGLFAVLTVPAEGRRLADLEAAVRSVMDRLATDGVSAAELARVRALSRTELLRKLTTSEGLARELAVHQASFGDWRSLVRELEGIDAVTAEQIRDVSQRYFTARNRTVVILEADPPDGERKAER